MKIVFLVYVVLSLLIGGIVATVETWSPRSSFDRADGRGKFQSPPVGVIAMGLTAFLIWPILLVSLILDARKGLLVTDHCDDYIDDPEAPPSLRKFLTFARSPVHGLLAPKPHPELYADHGGRRVRVTMASRMGDVGITSDLTAETGYEQRVRVKHLKNFSEVP